MGYTTEWRSEAAKIAREYPELLEKKLDAAGQSVTVSYSGMPGGGTATRTTENAALRSELAPLEERKLHAVDVVMAATRYFDHADERYRAFDLLYFQKRRWNINRTARCIGYSAKAIQQWNTTFLSMIWSHWLMD